MTLARVLAAAGLALVLLASASVALAAGRVALVVGNSTYSHIARLPNPENDAADMAAALQRLGFEVTTAQDADRASLNEALRVFTRESVGADMALVFYAGHGLEMDGVNYLVPVDARGRHDKPWSTRSSRPPSRSRRSAHRGSRRSSLTRGITVTRRWSGAAIGVRSYVSEPDRGRRHWTG